MSDFVIKGGNRLRGEIYIQGAKNEALQVLPAVLLTTEPVYIYNLPDIEDVRKLIDILKIIGVDVRKIGQGSYSFDSSKVTEDRIMTPEFREAFTHLRGSLMLVGPLLSRFGVACLPKPGGDKIGIRPITTHERAFIDLGANVEIKEGYKLLSGDLKRKISKRIRLKEASVTGTANAILASVVGEGIVEIYNAACEPYVQQLCKMLNGMGAGIVESHIGSNKLIIHRVSELKGCSHTVLPDFIEVGSFIALAMVLGDGITLKDALNPYLDLDFTLSVFESIGLMYQKDGRDLYIPSHKDGYEIRQPSSGKPKRVIYDQIWPGLSPDLISVILVASVFAKGSVDIEQRMFEDRLNFARDLNDMGAAITRATSKLVSVYGFGGSKRHLSGKVLDSPDIRAGMALLIAALAAEGQSTIRNADQIKRGYQNIVPRLNGLGANIREFRDL